jgi:hypothetical protein
MDFRSVVATILTLGNSADDGDHRRTSRGIGVWTCRDDFGAADAQPLLEVLFVAEDGVNCAGDPPQRLLGRSARRWGPEFQR